MSCLVKINCKLLVLQLLHTCKGRARTSQSICSLHTLENPAECLNQYSFRTGSWLACECQYSTWHSAHCTWQLHLFPCVCHASAAACESCCLSLYCAHFALCTCPAPSSTLSAVPMHCCRSCPSLCISWCQLAGVWSGSCRSQRYIQNICLLGFSPDVQM